MPDPWSGIRDPDPGSGIRRKRRCGIRDSCHIVEQLTFRPHGFLDLPQCAAPIVAERIERTDFRQRRELVAANASAGDEIVERCDIARDSRIRRSGIRADSTIAATVFAIHLRNSIRARKCCRSIRPVGVSSSIDGSSQPHFGQRSGCIGVQFSTGSTGSREPRIRESRAAAIVSADVLPAVHSHTSTPAGRGRPDRRGTSNPIPGRQSARSGRRGAARLSRAWPGDRTPSAGC